MTKEEKLTQATLKESLSYEPTTGIFVWIKNSAAMRRAGQQAGSLSKNGRIVIRVNGAVYYAHRLAWLYVYGEWPRGLIDHKNCNPTDNRIAKLRIADAATNSFNRIRRIDNSSGKKGVSWRDDIQKFRVRISVGGKRVTLGFFENLDDAAAAYAAAAQKLHGEFARIE